MSPRTESPSRRVLAWAVVAVVAITTPLTVFLSTVNSNFDMDSLNLGSVLFSALAAVVLFHQPRNRIGFALAGVGVLSAVGSLAEAVTAATYGSGRIELPGALWAGWVGDWYWLPMLWLQFVAIPLLFPTGRLPSRRWRWMGRVAWSLAAATTLLAAFARDLVLDGPQLGVKYIEGGRTVRLDNPLGVLPIGNFEEDVAVLLSLVFLCALGSTVALVFRFRRSTGIERHQIKVAVAGVTATVLGFVIFGGLDAAGIQFLEPLEIVFFLLIPVSLGVAILRYRLFDIDRIISRSLAYVIVTALLVGLYLGVVVVMQPLVRPLTGGGDLGVALATLAAAAAFRPLLRRIQQLVDRRFNRRVHDARQMVERFAEGLRDEVDVEAMRAELRRTASEMLEPASASLWLRPAGTEG